MGILFLVEEKWILLKCLSHDRLTDEGPTEGERDWVGGDIGLMEKQNPASGSTEEKGGLIQVWEATEKSCLFI